VFVDTCRSDTKSAPGIKLWSNEWYPVMLPCDAVSKAASFSASMSRSTDFEWVFLIDVKEIVDCAMHRVWFCQVESVFLYTEYDKLTSMGPIPLTPTNTVVFWQVNGFDFCPAAWNCYFFILQLKSDRFALLLAMITDELLEALLPSIPVKAKTPEGLSFGKLLDRAVL
jgi:hypothetical protein